MTAPDDETLEQAAALHAGGDPGAAARACRKILHRNPQDAAAWSLLGNCEMVQGHHPEAIAAFQRATALNPFDLDAHNRTGALHLTVGDGDAAIASFRAAVANGPDHPDGYNNLGTALALMGRLDEAGVAYAKSIALSPHAPETHCNMAGLLERQGRIVEAGVSFGRAIELSPGHLRARIGRVRMLQCMQDLDGWRSSVAACYGLGPWPPRLLGELLLNQALSSFLAGDLTTCAAAVARMAELPIETEPGETDHTVLAYRNFLNGLIGYRREHPAEPADRFPSLPMVGDSHCLPPAGTKCVLDGHAYRLTPHLAMGCKAWHLAAPTTGRLRVGFDFALRAAIGAIPDGTDRPWPVIIAFGEIDCREDDGIYPHHRKHGTDPLAAVPPLVKGYVDYVTEAVGRFRGSRNITPMLHGVPAPPAGQLTLAGDERKTFLEIVRSFNRELGRQAAARGMRFIDVYALTDSGDGTSDGRHHLDKHHLKPEVLAGVFGDV